jgi:hypothetical protein
MFLRDLPLPPLNNPHLVTRLLCFRFRSGTVSQTVTHIQLDVKKDEKKRKKKERDHNNQTPLCRA